MNIMDKIVETTSKFIVRHSSQLTSLQPYVYCNTEETANAVARCLTVGSRVVAQYKWQTDPEGKDRQHWCVTPDIAWWLADADEVRAGQFYIGVWTNARNARDIWRDIVKGVDDVDNYQSGIGPIENEAGFVLVYAHDHAHPAEMWTYRRELRLGDTFEYLNEPGQPYLVCDQPGYVKDIPENWRVSTSATSRDTKRWNARVKRIPHWNAPPAILPCVDPMGRFGKMSKGGLDGAECLRRYEEALRTESVGIMNGRQYVPVPAGRAGVVGGLSGGLSPDQVDLAKQVWTMRLSILREQQRKTDEETARKNALSCDDQDEMPNMVYVDG